MRFLRGLLAAALVLTTGLPADAAGLFRVKRVGFSTTPIVGPSALWNGAGGSGGTPVDPVDLRINTTAVPVALGSNPLATQTTSPASKVTVTQTAHGIPTGTNVLIAGATATGGISAANLNGYRLINVLDANTYTFSAGDDAASATSGGGAGVTVKATNTVASAKPAANWITVSDKVFSTNTPICADAEAKGGIAYGYFSGDVATTSITSPSIINYTDVNGVARQVYGYCVTLNATAFRAISESGSAKIYFTAVPTDTSMQVRVIGGAATLFNGDFSMTVYPRSADNDRSKTVCPTGGADFTSLADAITDARTATAKTPLITFNCSANIDLVSAADNYTAGTGRMVVTPAAGVTVTLGRTAAYSPSSTSTWQWIPGWDGIEFRSNGANGGNLVFDQKNFSVIKFTAQPAWFNGVRFTNSVGTLWSYYWNGYQHPGMGTCNDVVGNGTLVSSYWTDANLEYVAGCALASQRFVINTTVNQWADDAFSSTHYVFGTYLRYLDPTSFIGTYQGTSNYTGLQILGPANATVTKTAGDAAGGNLLLKVSGSTVATIALGYYSSDTNPTINGVATAINTFGSGWSATVPTLVGQTPSNRGTMRPSLLGCPTCNAGTFTDLVASTTLSLNAGADAHVDYWQGFSSTTVVQNVQIKNNILRDAVRITGMFNNGVNAPAQAWDYMVKRNITMGSAGLSVIGENSYTGAGSAQHYDFENNIHEAGVAKWTTNAVAGSIYNTFTNNIIGPPDTRQACCQTFTVAPPWLNSAYLTPDPGRNAPTNGANTGNFLITGWAVQFRDYANGDFRPALAGTLLSNLKAKNGTYDGRLLPYATSDVVGAWSKDDPPFTYPF